MMVFLCVKMFSMQFVVYVLSMSCGSFRGGMYMFAMLYSEFLVWILISCCSDCGFVILGVRTSVNFKVW
jgi:hypothetical protein